MRRPFHRNKLRDLAKPGTKRMQVRSPSMPMDYANRELRTAHLTMILEELDELHTLAQSITNPKQLADVKILIAHSRNMLAELMNLFGLTRIAPPDVSISEPRSIKYE